jgi:acyl carrier protein
VERQVLDRVRACVAKVVAFAPKAVAPRSRLTLDLGYASLDLVEQMFVLEQEPSIRLEQEDVSLSAQLGLPKSDLHRNEILTPKALRLLRKRFPAAGELLQDGIARKDLGAVIIVEGIAAALERKLATAR